MPSFFSLFSRLRGPACSLAAVAMLAGCDQACGDEIYFVQGDLGPDGRLASYKGWMGSNPDDYTVEPLDARTRGIEIVKEVRRGKGRFAQSTRLMTVHFTARDEAGRELGGGKVRFLHPPIPIPHDYSMTNRIGHVPESFANGLAGMRVGGERIFSAPADVDEYRTFMDHESMTMAFTLPNSGRVTYQVELLKVCRPQVCTRKTYSIPGATNQEVYVKSCD